LPFFGVTGVDVNRNANTTLKKRQSTIFGGVIHTMSETNRHLLALSAQIVAAHVGNNNVHADSLPKMIVHVYNTLADLNGIQPVVHDSPQPIHTEHVHSEHTHVGHDHTHAHNVYVHPTFGQTVFGDHLICMEDGLSMKMLKRHLMTVHGMTPDEYRAKWNLPDDYPMVASDYAKLRSNLAFQSGLGLKPEDRPAKSKKRG
jgi:predicted transcriptional regulator